MGDPTYADGRLDRRRFLISAGAVTGAGIASTLGGPSVAMAHPSEGPKLVPTPEPIPGGLPIGLPPPYDLIHIFLPGPTDVTLPFSGLQLMGLDVEPSTITDFNGSTALAFLVGTATGSDGAEYNLEADIRAFKGDYVAADGSTVRAAFSLI